ncbi:MAG: PadR family transcriptional regulator [Anaerolineae bacterium]|nr:PadR family transcriptional regulator [Anaerolineae bacterium]
MISDDAQVAYENLALELRRGVLVLAVLSQLRAEQYGYSLKQVLDGHGLEINEGTLYPLLRRLEGQGLLESDWRVAEGTRPRRYYWLNADGIALLRRLAVEWHELGSVMDDLLQGVGK